MGCIYVKGRFKQNQDVFKEYLFNLKELIQEFRGGFVQDLKRRPP